MSRGDAAIAGSPCDGSRVGGNTKDQQRRGLGHKPRKRSASSRKSSGWEIHGLRNQRPKALESAIELFISDKRSAGRGDAVLDKYERELARFRVFAETGPNCFPLTFTANYSLSTAQPGRSCILVADSPTSPDRLRGFLSFCHAHSWLDLSPKLSSIEADEPPTLLIKSRVREAAESHPKNIHCRKGCSREGLSSAHRRHSGLAIRDAVTLRAERDRPGREEDADSDYDITTEDWNPCLRASSA